MLLRTKTVLSHVLAGCLCAGIGAAQPATASASRDTLRVLFIGNSFTYFRNMPAMLESISSAVPGPAIKTTLVVHGGWRLSDHWDPLSVTGATEMPNGEKASRSTSFSTRLLAHSASV